MKNFGASIDNPSGEGERESMKIQTFIIEYTRPLDGRVWKTEEEAYDHDSAMENFKKEHYGLEIRECYLKEESNENKIMES